MLVAVLSDIHGNSDALREVLVEARELKVEYYIFLGDYVGYYYNVQECLELIETLPNSMIAGNHEDFLREYLHSGVENESITKKYGIATYMSAKTLGEGAKEKLLSLPRKTEIVLEGKMIGVFHESPLREQPYIYPNSPYEVINELMNLPFDIVLCGHSHYQVVFSDERGLLLNPGSVGQNRKRGGVACWATIDLKTRETELKQTPYKTDGLIEQVLQYENEDSYLIKVLKRV